MEILHPVISLLAFVDSDFVEDDVDQLRQLAEDLAASPVGWLLGPPQLVDETDHEDGVRTVGLVHHVYAAFDARGALLEESVDRQQLEEVRELIAGLQAVSARSGIDVGLELDDDSVGWIEQGELTQSLRVGFVEAWASRFA
jgi:hypothetical protein